MFTARRLTIPAITLALALQPLASRAGTLVTLHQFTGSPDGKYPFGFVYTNGSIFGTTLSGGNKKTSLGILFEIDPGTGAETIIHNFDSAAHGSIPSGPLVVKGDDIYGTAALGGSAGSGVIYRVKISTGRETVLYNFQGTGDGGEPGGLIYHSGMFYGTTGQVGDAVGGVVFSYDKNSGAETTLYSFGEGNAAGVPLIYSHGLLYGTESGNHESVFSLNPSNDTETTIYTFTNYPDGVGADFGVIMIDGIFYGVTHFGGHGEPGLGVVFKFDPSNGEYTVLHRFRGNKDGSLPLGPLTYRRGSLYGTTSYGGAGSGTIFKINPTSGRIDTLYTFTGGADGAAPNSQLFYENGAFYGTTAGGGVNSCNGGCGTVFKFTPGP